MFRLVLKVDAESELGKKGFKWAVYERGTKKEMMRRLAEFESIGKSGKVEKDA